LVTAVAELTATSVEQLLDRHFAAMLAQQQQLVFAVQQLARLQALLPVPQPATTVPPTGQLK
jgi:hypothetical protein